VANPLEECRNELNKMREMGKKNDELIPEAIRLIFFKLEERPSQSKVLSLLSHAGSSPSATTVMKYIDQFMMDVRSKLQVKLALPDMPASVTLHLEEALGSLWNKAVDEAQARFNTDRDALIRTTDTQLSEAKLKCQQLDALNTTLQLQVQDLQEKLLASEKEITELLDDVSSLRQQNQLLVVENTSANTKVSALELALSEEKEQHSLDVLNLNSKIQVIESNHADQITRNNDLYETSKEKLHAEIIKLNGLLGAQDETVKYLKVTTLNETDKRRDLENDIAKWIEKHALLSNENTPLKTELATLKGKFERIARKPRGIEAVGLGKKRSLRKG